MPADPKQPREEPSLQAQYKGLHERYKELEYQVNTLKGMALSTFGKAGVYSLLVFTTLALQLVPLFMDEAQPTFSFNAVVLLTCGFLVVCGLLIYNAWLLSKGIRRVSTNLRSDFGEAAGKPG